MYYYKAFIVESTTVIAFIRNKNENADVPIAFDWHFDL
jgi:hypothetical protein